MTAQASHLKRHLPWHVTGHDMSWHLSHFTRHALTFAWVSATWHEVDMSRRLMPAQGTEPETHSVPEWIGSDPIWCISWIQSDKYIPWIQSDVTCFGSDPTDTTLFTFLFNTHAHTAVGGFEWSSDVKSCCLHIGGIQPRQVLQLTWRVGEPD